MPKGEKVDWSNQVFNGCLIIEPLNFTKRSCDDKWKMQCHCGKIFYSKPSSFKYRNATSCGCYRAKIINDRCQKYVYYNFINKHNVKLIRPLEIGKEQSQDKWIALCPRHNPPVEFITTANTVTQNDVKSCGCIHTASEYFKDKRKQKGLNENQFIADYKRIVQQMTFDLIKKFILMIDGYTCCYCLNTASRLQVHHIDPINNFLNYSDIDTYKKMYDINNLITLCKECHLYKAHNGSKTINEDVQKELLTVVSMRPIDKKIYNEYINMVSTIIEPWIKNFIYNMEVVNA